jgi:hemoglobin-like flavoprotein
VSPESEQLVRQTWKQLEPVSNTMVATFYTRLFESNPNARALFGSTDMVEQQRKFRGMLAEIVRAIDNPDLLINEVAASGRRHVGYGVSDRDYDDVGAALIWAIGSALGPAFTTEVQYAWREAYALLAAVMKRAAARPTHT